MAKLYFRYGAMTSAKTLNLLAVRHNYEQQGKLVKIAKPRLDTRFGEEYIQSRAGLKHRADIILDPETILDATEFLDLHCLLIDEAQFLSASLVEQLRSLTLTADIPVIAYGLRTDFRQQLFEGSQRLLELADSIEEIKTTCRFCNRKAVFNLRHREDGTAIVDGPSVCLEGEECYSPACHPCYTEKTECAKNLAISQQAPKEGSVLNQ